MARFYQPKKKAQQSPKHQSVTVSRFDHKGAGIAYQERHPIFIEGALPNETVLIQITEKKSKYSRAKLIRVLNASPERQEPRCPHYVQCGGCHLQHMSTRSQHAYKQDTLHHLMKPVIQLDTELSPSIQCDDWGYRRRVRFSLKWQPQRHHLSIGFRQQHSHQIVDIETCPVLEPQLEQLVQPLQTLLRSLSYPSGLGHVELVLSDQRPVILLRHMQSLSLKDKSQISTWLQQHPATFLLIGDTETTQIGAEVAHEPSAMTEITYSELGMPIAFQPHHFIQVNRHVNEKMVSLALAWLDLTPQDRVLDLFCGVGNFSLAMAKQAKSVVGVEGIDAMVQQAHHNAQRNQLSNLSFYQANLEESIIHETWANDTFDKILLDPARAGAKGVIDVVGQFGAQRIIYVSCDPATMARDSQTLLAQGYQLEKLVMLDMFPQTHHFESMALFMRH